MLQPTRLISTPFAQEGEKTEIQNVTGEFDNSATYRLGFPPLTMQSIRLGGKPPKGTDFNGILFDITENISFLCKGGRYQYNAGLSTLIGGYPEGSNLLLDDNVTEVVSTINSNQNNPNINMTGWISKPNRTTAANVADASGETQQQVNYNGGSKWHSRVGGYLENERVVLSNGDIVKSTVAGNTNNPNVDMTGWVNDNSASQIKYENGIDAQTVKDRIVYIQDFDGSSTDFDPSVAEAEAKAVANPNSKPYDGARQFAFPMKTLKVWNYCDGYLDRGAVASIRNVDSFSSNEPRTEVLGINSSEQLASYTDRDVVGLYVQAEGQPALLTSANTTYTATTVTCSDIESKRNFIRKDQIIDVVDGAIKYSGRIQGIDGNTVTVDGWYIHGTSNTGTPSTGSQVKFVPNTKVWATNFNVMLKPESDAESMVGIELGVFNNKYVEARGYGYDMWSGGANPINQAFQARGKYYSGLHLQGEYQFGVISEASNNISFYDKDSPVGFLSQGSDYGVVIKDAKNQALDVQDVTGRSLTAMSPTGAWKALKYEISVINTPTTIDQTSVMIFVDPNVNGMVVNLPTPSNNERRTIFVKNLSATNTVFLAGVVENGGGSYHLQTKETVQMICDAVTWFPISKHTF